MTSKKRPSPPSPELEKLLRQLDQAPRQPEAGDQDLNDFSPWNVSMKNPRLKRTIAFSLAEEETK